MQLNIPTWFTLLRIILIPFFVLAFYLPFAWAPMACTVIFVLAATTDWLDGFLARHWKQTTRFGAFLDPAVDKVMMVIALMLVAEYYHSWWATIPVATVIAREIIVSSLREWMAEIGKRNCVKVSWVGKVKTAVQMISLVGLLWHPNSTVEYASLVLFYIATALTFWSMFLYLNVAWSDLLEP